MATATLGDEVEDDLKQFLTQMETRLSQHILHEMSLRFNKVDSKLNSVDERLRLQAGLIQGGARALEHKIDKLSDTGAA